MLSLSRRLPPKPLQLPTQKLIRVTPLEHPAQKPSVERSMIATMHPTLQVHLMGAHTGSAGVQENPVPNSSAQQRLWPKLSPSLAKTLKLSLGAGKDPAGLPESFVLSKNVHLAT
ncbi:hypothetical protein IMSHALPRED_002723 [Imshaugia aleurites]|uniref:Uncharacterized protein n=1 Tax=Imshaugia aleurites TaxID=172621 RepID=A0A8H3F2J7_9LECA|nr:hypothetical protein IMSHALPRED_002723 [Imshaugia aleurites]